MTCQGAYPVEPIPDDDGRILDGLEESDPRLNEWIPQQLETRPAFDWPPGSLDDLFRKLGWM